MVIFVSSEHEEFPVTKELAVMSRGYASLVEEDEDDDTDEVEDHKFPLLNVDTETLKFVIEFCTLYTDNPMKSIPKPLESYKLSDYISTKYCDFINRKTKDQLYRIIMAANYMDIPPLLQLGCAKIASMIKGKTPEEIRREFNILNDFSPEEETKIREENMWIPE